MACKRRKSNSVSRKKVLAAPIDDKIAGDFFQYKFQFVNNDDCYQCKRKIMLKLAEIGISQLLTDRQRICFLRKINGEKAKRIAKDMGLSVATVYKHVRKAKARLSFMKDIF